MTIGEAVRSALRKYAVFQGRAGGTEYWWFALVNLAGFALAAGLDQLLFDGQKVFWLAYSLLVLLPTLAVGARRLHDTNRSAWWQLLMLIPGGGIVLLIWFCTPSNSGPNRYGEMPGAINDDGVAVW